jgi:hypothetical protein
LFEGTFFKAVWVFWEIGNFTLELGTPQLFDLGVFLIVVSVVVSYLLSLGHSSEGERS